MKNLELKIEKKVAIDRAGNILADSAGNCVITIPAPVITVSTSERDPAAFTARLSVNDAQFVNSGSLKEDSDGFSVQANDLYSFRITPHLRNTGSIVLSIDAGVDIDRSTVAAYSAAGLEIRCQWGNQSIVSDTLYACLRINHVYHLGEVAIDAENFSLTLDTSRSSLSTAPFKCTGGYVPGPGPDPEPPETIKVSAPESYCSEGITLYAGDYYPLLWDASEKVVEYDETTTVTTALQNAALGVASSEKANDYLVAEDGKCYWADETYVPESIGSLQVHPAVLVGQDDVVNNYQFCRKDLWCENVINGAWTADTTGRLFSKAYYEGGDPDTSTLLKYDVNTCIIKEEPKQVVDTVPDTGIEYVHLARSSAGTYGYGYMVKTGKTTTLSAKPSMGYLEPTTYAEYVTFDGAKTCWMIDGYSGTEREIAAFPSEPYWVEVSDGIYELRPSTHDEFGGQIFTLRRVGQPHCFKWIDGLYYTTARQSWNGGLIGYVYEFVRRWKATDCSGEGEAVFTRGSSARCYATAAEAEDANPNGGTAIVRRGNSRYSIDFAGSTYKRTGLPMETAAAIEEEFE